MGLIALILLPMSIINPGSLGAANILFVASQSVNVWFKPGADEKDATHMPVVEVRAHKRTYLMRFTRISSYRP